MRDDHPPFRYEDYRSTRLRSPKLAPIAIAKGLSETTGPGPIWSSLCVEDADLTINAGTGSRAAGPQTIVAGRLLDEANQPIRGAVIEIWQANASGRYLHPMDNDHAAPIDPHFIGVGRCKTDAEGAYRFVTVRPGAYPWKNHENAWRPAHIHFSVFGPSQNTRLITQMYFPGDPLLALDPIFGSVPAHCRERLIARYDHAITEPMRALGYHFDLVLPGERTP